MPWKERSIMSQRQELVVLAGAEGANRRELCRRFDISPTTAYKWIRRYRDGGEEGLGDRSRRPQRSPAQTAEAVEQAVMAMRTAHPAWGGRKIRRRLKNLGHADVPAASTITVILHRRGMIDEKVSTKHTAFQRFERSRPNELWQMDFKGHVELMREVKRCHPLTVLDDCTRYAIGVRACEDEKGSTVQMELTSLFRCYGLPEAMLTDNGTPWGIPCPGDGLNLTSMEVWLLRRGVKLLHGRPHHPQTQGKDERFHRTLKAEVLSRRDLRDLDHAQREFDAWRPVYNSERPHESLGMETPASRYEPSRRSLPEQLPELEFGPDDQVRRVGQDGAISYRGQWRFISEALASERIGLRPSSSEGVLDVCYGPYVVGELDVQDRSVTTQARPPGPRRGEPRLGPPLAALAPAPAAEDQ